MRAKWFFIVLLLMALGLASFAAYTHRAVQKAPRYYFRMAPVDPRALLLGDYMRLSYDIARGVKTDSVRVYVGENNIVTTEKIDGAVSFAIPVRQSGRLRRGPADLRLPKQFYFEEGQGKKYNAARYVQLARTSDGRFFVTALADENLQPL